MQPKFLLDNCTDGKLGMMPFNQQFGFIFTNGQSNEQLTHTMAHELQIALVCTKAYRGGWANVFLRPNIWVAFDTI